MYPMSLIFDVPSSAFVGLACINLFLGVVTTISAFVLQLFDDQELKYIGTVLAQVYLVFPHYCLGGGLINLAQAHYRSAQLATVGELHLQ